jgi:virginiamycin A acetyltransferase
MIMPNIIHESVKIGKLTSIETSVKDSILSIGPHSVIDDFVKIKFVGGIGNIEIGDNTYVNSGTVLYSSNGIKIGNYVLIGPNCSIVPTGHEFRDRDQNIKNQGFGHSKGGIVIEDDVWIGANVTILDGAYIKRGAVIGANSLILGTIEENSVNYGVPAKCQGFRV